MHEDKWLTLDCARMAARASLGSLGSAEEGVREPWPAAPAGSLVPRLVSVLACLLHSNSAVRARHTFC